MNQKRFQLVFSVFTLLSLMVGLLAPVPVVAKAAASSEGTPVITVEPEVLEQFAEKGNATYRIYFSDKADLTAAAKMNWSDRGWYVYNQLTATAKSSQAAVKDYLDANSIKYQAFWINNTVAVESSSKSVFDGLMKFSGIEAIRAPREAFVIEPEVVPVPETGGKGIEANISHVNADDVWALGYMGEGITVANIDTGVRYTHQALVDHYRGNLGGGSFDSNYNWWDPYGDHPTAPGDDNGHGSHTMGTMVGNDGGANVIGMAPGAKWIACRGCSTSSCTDTALLGCAEFMAAPTDLTGANADPDKRPNVVNNSWGDCSTSYDAWYRDVVDAWQAAGVYPVFSNGNASNCGYSAPPGLNTVGNPARYGNVTGVGSSGQSNGQYATHSNWGPTDNLDTINPAGFPELKPQVIAPGVNIRSSVPTSDSSYEGGWSGTSMSAPHVTGLIALIWNAAPCLVGDYATTETIIEESAVDITYDDGSAATPTNFPNYATGWGEIDALAAVNQAMGMCGDSTLQGTVSDAKGPVANATVDIVGADPDHHRTVKTNASGQYSAAVFADTYSITVSAYGFEDATATGVVVASAATVTQNFVLTALPAGTVTGTVLDGGHDYPLYAKVTVTAPGFSTSFFTDPFTGAYSVSLLDGETYSFAVEAVLAGFEAAEEDVVVSDGLVKDFELAALDSCIAPGYGISGAGVAETFDSVTAPALPAGWATANVSNTAPWLTNAGTLHPSGNPAHSGTNVAIFKSYSYSSGYSGRLYKEAAFDMSAIPTKEVHFWMYHDTGYSSSNDLVQVQVSVDGGTTWVNVGAAVSRYSATAGWTEHVVDLSAYGSETSLMLGFLGVSAYGNDVHIDDITVGSAGACGAFPGGMVAGFVSDANTSVPIVDASVWNQATPDKTAVSFATPDDADVDDGIYYLFSSAGAQTIVAGKDGYGDNAQPVTVVASDLVQQDFELGTGYLTVTPAAVAEDVLLGGTGSASLLLENDGTAGLSFEIKESGGDFTPAKASDVLVVAVDTDATASVEATLDTLGVTYDETTATAFAAMPVADLLEYSAVFHMGTSSSTDQPKLVEYLDAGGSLYISDNDEGYYNKTTAFYTTYLQSTYIADNGGTALTGLDIMAGIDLNISADPYPDSFSVGAEGVKIYEFSAGGPAGGVAVERGDYKAIYTSFDFNDMAANADEAAFLEAVYSFLGASDVAWLSASPITGTIAAGESLTVDVALDASALGQPGDYTANLVFKTDTVYGKVTVPVTMTVTPPANFGKIFGVVTGQELCGVAGDVLEGATVNIYDAADALVLTLETDELGAFSYWLAAGDYSIEVLMDNYLVHTEDFTLDAAEQQNLDADLVMDAPCLAVAPTSFTFSVELGETDTDSFTITNSGTAGAAVEIIEMDKGFVPGKVSIPAVKGHTPNAGISSIGAAPDSAKASPFGVAQTFAKAGVLAYGVDLENTQLGSFNTETPGTWDIIGSITGDLYSGDFLNGDFSKLYVLDADSNNLVTVDTGDASIDIVGAAAAGAGESWTGLTATPDGGLLASGTTCSASTLYSIDSATGEATEIGAIPDAGCLIAIAMNANGELYGVDLISNSLIEINPATGASTVVGDLGVDPNYAQGMDFDDDSGILYWAAYTTAGELRVIDTETGASTLVAALPAEVDSFAIATGGVGDVAWLSESPITATIAAPGTQDVTVNVDASVLGQPGTYRAEIVVKDVEFPVVKLPVTLTVTPPADYGKIEGIVTGQLLCGVAGDVMQGVGVGVYDAADTLVTTLTTDADGAYLYWLPAGNYTLKAVMEGYVMAEADIVVAGSGATTTTNFDLVLDAPCLTVDPTSAEATLAFGAQTTETLTIANSGPKAGDFEITEKDLGYVPGKGFSAPVYSSPSKGEVKAEMIFSDIELVLDDGTTENNIGLTSGGQFIWLNQFTPATDSFPFNLEEVQVLFPDSVVLDSNMQLVVYSDPDGDPTNGATYLGGETFKVVSNDGATWNTFTLSDPIAIEDEGDVLIGFVNRSGVAGTSDLPAAIDEDTAAQRSWVGLYSGDVPAEPPLPADDTFDLIDNLLSAGTWNVRGYGSTGGGDAVWLSETPVTATVAPDGSVDVTLDFDAAQVDEPGQYHAELRIKQAPYPQIVVPVTMNVNPASGSGSANGTVSGLGLCDAAPATAIEGATVEFYQGATLIKTRETDANGTFFATLLVGDYTVKVTADTFVIAEADITVADQATVTQNFTLHKDAPCLSTTTTQMTVTMNPDTTRDLGLALRNLGYAAGDFEFLELPVVLKDQLIQDGSFETGTPNSFWEEYSSGFGTPLCDPDSCNDVVGARTGDWWIWFGGTADGDVASMAQDVTINPGTASLSFWVQLKSCGAAGADNFANLTVDGTELWREDGTNANCGESAYRQVSVDVSAYADGSSHEVKFSSETVAEASAWANISIDDVELNLDPFTDVSWLSETPETGTIAAGGRQNVVVTFDTAGLAVGEYHAILRIKNAPNGNIDIPVTLIVTNDAIIQKLFLPLINR